MPLSVRSSSVSIKSEPDLEKIQDKVLLLIYFIFSSALFVFIVVANKAGFRWGKSKYILKYQRLTSTLTALPLISYLTLLLLRSDY